MPTMGDKLSTKKIGRIASEDWTDRRAALTTAVYNANYGAEGILLDDFPLPWTVIGPAGVAGFATHTEALAWAFKKAEAGR